MVATYPLSWPTDRPRTLSRRAAAFRDGASGSKHVSLAAARGMAETIGETLLLADTGETFVLSSRAIWAKPLALALAVDPRQATDELDAA